MCAATAASKSVNKPAALPPVLDQPEWHALEPAKVASRFDVDPTIGLTRLQVIEREHRYGRNVLQQIKSRPAWRVLVDQFTNIVIGLLAVAAVIAWATGDDAEAIAILVVLVLNAIVGFATEWQDLICMGASGIDWSSEKLLGSKVDRVLREAPCPVLVAGQQKHSYFNAKN